jgi:hypothetical protein
MFQMIDNAPFAPGGCMICGGTGPKNAKIMDLMQEFSGQQLRLYLCKIHYREVAVTAGYAKGERMDELDKAAEQIVEIEKVRDEAIAAATKMADELTRIQQRATVLERELEAKRDQESGLLFRAQQLQTMANEMIVGAGNGG